jgi:hypothetical protein
MAEGLFAGFAGNLNDDASAGRMVAKRLQTKQKPA